MRTKTDQQKANSIARNAGYGRATKIIYGPEDKVVEGENYCYRTHGGTIINHPSAYAEKGWSNMVYWHAHCTVQLAGEPK